MQPKKHYFAHIPTIAIFIVFAMSAPLGVLLFILKSIDRNAEKEEKAAAQAQADYRSDLGPASAQTAPRQENEPAYGHDVPTKEQKDAKERHKLLTTLCTIGGAVFLFAGFSTLFMDGADSMMEAFTAIAQMLGGGAALLTGLRMDRTRKLERLLDKIAGDRDNIPLDELFAAAGIDAAKGRTVVESAISHGYFGADAYIDNPTPEAKRDLIISLITLKYTQSNSVCYVKDGQATPARGYIFTISCRSRFSCIETGKKCLRS